MNARNIETYIGILQCWRCAASYALALQLSGRLEDKEEISMAVGSPNDPKPWLWWQWGRIYEDVRICDCIVYGTVH